MSMSAIRNSKIQRYKEQKELEKKIQDLREVVEQDHIDDEVKVIKLRSERGCWTISYWWWSQGN